MQTQHNAAGQGVPEVLTRTSLPLSAVRESYETKGQLSTVYLSSGSPTENAKHQVSLRWDNLKQQLQDAGTSESSIDLLEAELLAYPAGQIEDQGRVLVATEEELVLSEPWSAPPSVAETQDANPASVKNGAQDLAILGDTAQLGPYLREQIRSMRVLVVITDKTHAVMRRSVITSSAIHESAGEVEVSGGGLDTVHKPREGALSHKHIQRSADEAAKRNIRDIVDDLEGQVKDWIPDVVVVAGELQGRKLLMEELPHSVAQLSVEVDAGGGIPSGGADEATEEALAQEVFTVARRLAIERVRRETEEFDRLVSQNLAVQGRDLVENALRMGAVDTLLLRYSETAKREEQLIASAAQSDSRIGLIGSDVADHVAATLRYEAPVEGI